MDLTSSESEPPSAPNPGVNIRMTSDKMLSQVLDWNLACDTAVLNRLKDYSENMLRRATTIKEDCNSCAQEVDMLQTRVQSATSQFLNLANDQFVENCVEEFEERDVTNQASPSPLVHQVKTKAEKEAELIKKMKESIQLGIKSNSLTDQLSSVPKVKTAHIIGTSKFFGSRFCGLLEDDRLRPALHLNTVIPETPLGQQILDHDRPTGLSESISIPKAPSSTDSENLFQTRATTQSQLSKPESSLSSEENFLGASRTPFTSSSNSVGTNQSHETDLRRPGDYPTARPPISIIDDLNNVLKARVPPPTTVDSDSEEDFKPRSGTGRDLFADDDDDIFTAHANASAHSIRPPEITDRSSCIPSKITNSTPVPKNSAAPQINSIADLLKAQRQLPEQIKAQPAKQSVFRDSDSDGEGDLFSSSSSARSSSKPPTKTTNYNSLFADDQKSVPQQKPQPHASAPRKAVIPETQASVLQPTPTFPNIRAEVPKLKQKQQRSIFDESDSDDDLFSASSSKRGGGTSTASTDTEQPTVEAKIYTNKFPGPTNFFENVSPTKSNIVIEHAKVVPTNSMSKSISTSSADTEVTMSATATTSNTESPAAAEKIIKSPESEPPTPKASTSKKAISQKLENIFKVTGPPLPGMPPKRTFSKPEVSSEVEASQDAPEEKQESTNATLPDLPVVDSRTDIHSAEITVQVDPITGVKQTPQSPTFENKGMFNEHKTDAEAGGKNKSTVSDTNLIVRQISQRSLLASSDEDGLTQSFSSSSVDNQIDYEHPVTFDDPPKSNLLISATKNRVKIAHKRRRPTQKPMVQVTPELTNEATNITEDENRESKPISQPEQGHISKILSDSTVSEPEPSIAPSNASTHSPAPSVSSEPTNMAGEKNEKMRADSAEIPNVSEPKVAIVAQPKPDGTSTDGPSGSAAAARNEMSIKKTQVPATATHPTSEGKPDMKVFGQPKKAMKQSIFDDSDSDSDDIFPSAKPKTIPSASSSKAINVNGVSSPSTATLPDSSQISDSAHPTQGKVLQKSSNMKQQSIFAESDSDSGDDIFAPKKNKQNTGNPKNKTANLFGDYSVVEESSDVFRSSGQQPQQASSRTDQADTITEKSTTKPAEPQKSQSSKPTKAQQKQKSIFDDDSDSDSDIFTSKSTKAKFV